MRLHSLDMLAADVVADLRSGKTVFVQFPELSNREFWQDAVISACQNELRLQGEDASFERLEIESDEPSPEELLDVSDFSSDGTLSRFLTEYDYDPIVFCLENAFSKMIRWSNFFEAVTREQKSIDHKQRSRLILVITDGEEIPSRFSKASIAAYQFWNPVRWEELRLAADELLGAGNNDATQAWMVATYVGAAKLNPVCLQELCIEKPRTIGDVLLLCDRHFTRRLRTSARSDIGVHVTGNSSWKLPEHLMDEWLQSGLIGTTLDRGMRHSVALENEAERQDAVRREIWKEQAAGILPLVMEVSYRTNRALDKVLSENWRNRLGTHLGCSEDESYFREPADILDFIYSSMDNRIPDTFFKLLKELKYARNKLAHLVPIELSAVNKIWDMHVRSQNR